MYCTACAVVILLKLCLEHTVRMCSTQYVLRPTKLYRHNLFAAMVLPVRIPCFLFCEHLVCFANSTHCTTHCTVAVVLKLPHLLSFFLAVSFFPPCLPFISAWCSIVVLLLFVMWLSSHCTLMNLMMAFLAYCRCITTALYGLHCMAVSVHPVYSTVCTMVGVALPHHVHVHAAWYGSFRTPGVQYCLYHRWCLSTVSYACTPVHASWYGMVGASQPYCMHVHVACTVVSVHRLYSTVRTILVP